MTREEAIKQLKQIIDVASKMERNEKEIDAFDEEALEMAIKALEQEPSGDLISREELLKTINTWDKFGCDADTKLVPYKDHYIPYIHYDDVVKCIKGIPSVKPQERTGHWIMHDNGAWWECSECHAERAYGNEYCPDCGSHNGDIAKMVEQESEIWNGIHAQITAPKGTFERIFNEADDDNDI